MPDVAEVLDDEGTLEDPLSVVVFESDLDAVSRRPGPAPSRSPSSRAAGATGSTPLGWAWPPTARWRWRMVDLMVLNDPFAVPADELEAAAPPAGRDGFWARLLGRRGRLQPGSGSMAHH